MYKYVPTVARVSWILKFSSCNLNSVRMNAVLSDYKFLSNLALVGVAFYHFYPYDDYVGGYLHNFLWSIISASQVGA